MAVTVLTNSLCGFCATGQHGDKCAVGTKHRGRHDRYPNGVVWACRCKTGDCRLGRLKCAHCGNRNTQEVDPTTWECFDIEACHALVEKRWAEDPFNQQLRDIKERVEMAKVQENKAKASKAKATKPKTGTCVCGCNGTTKGGKFLPGHDARFVSTLVNGVAEANFKKANEQSARKALKDVGASDALNGKFEKSLGLARERAEKREAAVREKAEAKG